MYDKLFEEIGDVVELDEIAILKIEDQVLVAVYKNDTELFANEEWIAFHQKYPTYIDVEEHKIIRDTIRTKDVCYIEDTNSMPKKPAEFKKLDVRSIYLIPIKRGGEVTGVVNMVYREKCKILTKAQIDKCTEIVNRYNDILEL